MREQKTNRLRPRTFSDYAALVIIGVFAGLGLIRAFTEGYRVIEVLTLIWLLLMLLWAFVHVINMIIQDEGE